MIDFDKWNDEFGGADAVAETKQAQEMQKDFEDVPDGTYICKLEKMELGESKAGKPMIKGMFRVTKGSNAKRCIFINQCVTRGYPMAKGIEFLNSLKVFDRSEVEFNGNYMDFNDLVLDIAENAEGMTFEVKKVKDGDFDRVTVLEAY